jgi:hypothetical protein
MDVMQRLFTERIVVDRAADPVVALASRQAKENPKKTTLKPHLDPQVRFFSFWQQRRKHPRIVDVIP